MTSPEQILAIGIERLAMMREMAKIIINAETKEDILFILKTMEEQLDEGITEIDVLCKQMGE
ncbi:hypothetical protein GQ473_00365 [archaeon]|nr:hypothetical protein [archaeon]